jgi:hypothetical protein
MSKRRKHGKRVAADVKCECPIEGHAPSCPNDNLAKRLKDSGPTEKARKEIIATSYHAMRQLLALRETLARWGTVQECADFDRRVSTLALACVLTPMTDR